MLGVALRILLVERTDCLDCKPIAAALAVGLTVFLMVLLNLVHPPAGATALFAVYAGWLGHFILQDPVP